MVTIAGWVVVNDRGHVVPCMDGGKALHHVAVWNTEAKAREFHRRMSELNGDHYTVLVATLAPKEGSNGP